MQQDLRETAQLTVDNTNYGILVTARGGGEKTSGSSGKEQPVEIQVQCHSADLIVGSVTIVDGNHEPFQPWWATALLPRSVEPRLLHSIQQPTHMADGKCTATHLLSNALEAVLKWKEMNDNEQSELLSDWRDMAVKW